MKSTILLFLGSLLTFIMPVQGLIVLVMGVVILDTISGIYAAVRIGGRKAYRSGVLFNIAPKLFMYVGTTLLLFLVDVFIFQKTLFGIGYLLSKSISMIWVYIELKSIDENSQKLGNKPFLDNAKEFFKFIRNFKKDINSI